MKKAGGSSGVWLRTIPRNHLSPPSRGCPGFTIRCLKDSESRLGEFARSFQCPMGSVSGPAIKAWLQSKAVSNRTRKDSRLAIQTQFSFSKASKFLAPHWKKMDAVPI